jgi:hypothetical protein
LASTAWVPGSTRGATKEQIRGAPDGNFDIRLQPVVVVERRDGGRRRDAIPLSDRDVSDNPRLRGINAVVLELDLPFAQLRIERPQACFGRAERVLCLLELLAADGSRADQRFEPFDLPAPVGGIRFGARTRRLGALDRRPLPLGVDLHQRGAGPDAIAGLHEDSGNDALHLRLDGRRAQ